MYFSPTFLVGRRATGLLLHPSSLPGFQGIGSLGAEARVLSIFLKWQAFPTGKLALVQLVLEILLTKYLFKQVTHFRLEPSARRVLSETIYFHSRNFVSTIMEAL